LGKLQVIFLKFPNTFTISYENIAYALFVFLTLEKPQACGPYRAFLSLAVFNATLLGVLVLILLLKAMDIMKLGRPTPHRQMDFLTAREWTREAREKARETFNPRIMFMCVYCFQRRKKNFLTWPIRPLFSRILVVAIVYFTVAIAWRMTILSPLHETNSIPLRESRSSSRYDHESPPDHTYWRVVIVRETFSVYSDSFCICICRQRHHSQDRRIVNGVLLLTLSL